MRAEIPKVTDILVFDGPAPDGMTAVDELMAAASTEPPPEIEADGARPGRR